MILTFPDVIAVSSLRFLSVSTKRAVFIATFHTRSERVFVVCLYWAVHAVCTLLWIERCVCADWHCMRHTCVLINNSVCVLLTLETSKPTVLIKYSLANKLWMKLALEIKQLSMWNVCLLLKTSEHLKRLVLCYFSVFSILVIYIYPSSWDKLDMLRGVYFSHHFIKAACCRICRVNFYILHSKCTFSNNNNNIYFFKRCLISLQIKFTLNLLSTMLGNYLQRFDALSHAQWNALIKDI